MMRYAPLLALLLLGACGLKGPLEPVPPAAMPVAQRGQTVAPTPAQMLVVPVQAAPQRVDDPVKKSEERPDDRFNIPPQ
jgi:predicted small lipoprotein YifL